MEFFLELVVEGGDGVGGFFEEVAGADFGDGFLLGEAVFVEALKGGVAGLNAEADGSVKGDDFEDDSEGVGFEEIADSGFVIVRQVVEWGRAADAAGGGELAVGAIEGLEFDALSDVSLFRGNVG